jgi:hypothetical protein
MSKRVKPHQVRGRELEEVREKDPDGRIVMVEVALFMGLHEYRQA